MSPCHTRNHGRRYTYYASNQADGSREPAQRLPAGELNSSARQELVALLKDQRRLSELGEHLDVEARGELFAYASNLADVITNATIAEFRDQLAGLSAKVTVTQGAALMTVSTAALFAQLQLTSPEIETLTVKLPTKEACYGHESRLRLDPPSGPVPVRDDKLAHLIGRGFAARERLMSMTADEHSAMPQTEARHLERIARLAYLDPAIVRNILSGTQPTSISARSLWRMAAFPLAWAEQRQVLGFGAN